MPTTLTRAEKSCIGTLSALFLDTNLTNEKLDDIARVLTRLPLEIAEIEMLFWHDLFPTLIWNLLKTHGQQHAFEEDVVCGKIEVTRAASSRLSLGKSIKKLIFRWMVWLDWMRVKRRYLAEKRKQRRRELERLFDATKIGRLIRLIGSYEQSLCRI